MNFLVDDTIIPKEVQNSVLMYFTCTFCSASSDFAARVDVPSDKYQRRYLLLQWGSPGLDQWAQSLIFLLAHCRQVAFIPCHGYGTP